MRWFTVSVIAVAMACPVYAVEGPKMPPGTVFFDLLDQSIQPGQNPPGADVAPDEDPAYWGRKLEIPDEVKARIIELRRANGAPELPDLSVFYIEQTPRCKRYMVSYKEGLPPYLTADEARLKRWPAPGETTTFWAHIGNCGLRPSVPTDWALLVDGKEIASGELPAIEPEDEVVVSGEWPWEIGRHKVTCLVDQPSRNGEITKLNNNVSDFTDAYTLLWTVRTEAHIHQSTRRNRYGSYSSQDWHRSVMEAMNDGFANAIFPLTPNGVRARVRIGYYWVHPRPWEVHGNHPLQLCCDGGWAHYIGGTPRDGESDEDYARRIDEECARYAEANALYIIHAPGVDTALAHELSHQLGLIDVYHMNVPARLCSVTMDDGRLLRDVLPAEAEKRTWQLGLMCGGQTPQIWEEHQAYSLELDYGKRRGYFGFSLLDAPQDSGVRVLDKNGDPIAGARVRVYQRQGEDVPDVVRHEGKTDRNGVLMIGKDAWGLINVVGVNASLLYRIDHPTSGEADWIWNDLLDYNLAHWRNPKEKRIILDLKTGL